MLIYKIILLFMAIWLSPRLISGFMCFKELKVSTLHTTLWAASWTGFIVLQWLI